MYIHLHQKMIKDMCGLVSFKRGDAFYRADKVRFELYSQDVCRAVVIGNDDFYVTIEKDSAGSIKTTCSCPSLASFGKDCQHIAAVLVAILEHQRKGTQPFVDTNRDESRQDEDSVQNFLTLFREKPVRRSGHQRHFENRKVLETELICRPVSFGQDYRIGIELKIGGDLVQNIRQFLEHVRTGSSILLSPFYAYDPELHCFDHKTDAVIQQLIDVTDDEKVYVSALPDDFFTEDSILIMPPSSWERILPLLATAPHVKLQNDGRTFEGLRISEAPLPLQFILTETDKKGFRLETKGLDMLIMLDTYHSVLCEGNIIQLVEEDYKRLIDLRLMIAESGANQLPIAEDQLDFFLEKAVPGLKKLGKVEISDGISSRLEKPPLIAKLYLDRLKNRLLAGLEFHYGHIVINPFEIAANSSNTLLVRDMVKEEAILAILEEASFAKTDGGYFLQNEVLEYQFLFHLVPKLEKLVQIYATTAVRTRIFRENARPQISVRIKKERTNWLEFKFQMDGISDTEMRQVLAALEEKRKYYRLRNGSLMSLETREFEEIQRFLKAVPAQKEDWESGLEVPLITGIQMLDTLEGNDAFLLEKSFREFLHDIRNPEHLEFQVPESLESVLRDYQVRGYKWMKSLASYGFGGILADDMGLGKTLQSIAFIQSVLPDIRKRELPVLIVCPSSLVYNWASEILSFAPDIQALVVDGKKTDRARLLEEAIGMDVVITSYPLLRKDIDLFKQYTFHTVFFDEAQAFKNPVTQTARTVKRVMADHRFALTGTPVENSIEELWSIFHVVFPELLQGLKAFSGLSRKAIARRTRPFLLRRLKEDVLSELPGKVELMETAELLPDQKKLYAAYLAKLREDTLKHLDKDTFRKNKIRILAGLTRLRQICCHPGLFVDKYRGSSAKYEQLMQILEESRLSGRRLLIFSQFTKMLEMIGRDLSSQGLPFFYLDGQTPPEQRVELCNRYNAGERDVFLISLKAGGTGLNLTGADTVVLYDLWWNPAVEQQAADRAHRMGQTQKVQVIKLVARGTIEEKMNELQEKKRHLVEELIDSDHAAAQLTEEDIREILMI
ncbi:SNF2 helicase associated domain-containing protein [Peribacillus sp. SCS-155]|uniref:SNF2 helicase associated domain-containing protein n=1 Tax=Peribacillus sedimenti TaxID=3115297 RepID=UPI003905C1BE